MGNGVQTAGRAWHSGCDSTSTEQTTTWAFSPPWTCPAVRPPPTMLLRPAPRATYVTGFQTTAALPYLLLVFLAGCRPEVRPPDPEPSLHVTSPAFSGDSDTPIPVAYTCAGRGVSPPFSWDTPPRNTASVVLIVERLDDLSQEADRVVLWSVYDLPPGLDGLPEAADVTAFGDGHLVPAVGTNHFGTVGYDGPCPAGAVRGRYAARVYALDNPLGLEPGASGDRVLAAVERQSLASGQVVGAFAYPEAE